MYFTNCIVSGRHYLSSNGGAASSNLLGVHGMTLLGTLVRAGSEELGIVGGSLLGSHSLGLLNSHAMTLTLECDGRDKTLDLGGLPLALTALFLAGHLTVDDKLADVVLLAQVEKLADLAGTLRPEAAGNGAVGEPGDGGLPRLGNDESEGGDVGTDDAATDGLAAALTGAARAVAGVAGGEEETGAAGEENSLLHGEALLVVATGDLQHVALPLVAEGVGLNLLSHALLVENAAKQIKSRLVSQVHMIDRLMYSLCSSTTSKSFCRPVAGLAMFS